MKRLVPKFRKADLYLLGG